MSHSSDKCNERLRTGSRQGVRETSQRVTLKLRTQGQMAKRSRALQRAGMSSTNRTKAPTHLSEEQSGGRATRQNDAVRQKPLGQYNWLLEDTIAMAGSLTLWWDRGEDRSQDLNHWLVARGLPSWPCSCQSEENCALIPG